MRSKDRNSAWIPSRRYHLINGAWRLFRDRQASPDSRSAPERNGAVNRARTGRPIRVRGPRPRIRAAASTFWPVIRLLVRRPTIIRRPVHAAIAHRHRPAFGP